MKVIRIVLIMGFLFILSENAFTQERRVNWDSFSINLVKALSTKNDGLQQSAMGLIIRYADSLDVRDAAGDIVNIYVHSKDQNFRRLAMVTLFYTNNKWAMGVLNRSLKYEKNETLKNHGRFIVAAYYKPELLAKGDLDKFKSKSLSAYTELSRNK